MTAETLSYPAAPERPVQETIGGIEFVDPYEWMEEDSPETLAWQEAQNDLAVRYLHSWPGYEPLKQRLAAYSGRQVAAPHRAGDRWFRITPADTPEGRAVLRVAASPREEGRILVDPNAIEADAPVSLDWYFPSPQGTYIAYGLSQRGDEQSVLHVVEVETSRVLPDRIPETMQSTVAWLPDESGFYYAGTKGTGSAAQRLFFHRLGEPNAEEPEPIENPNLFCRPATSDDGRYLVAGMGDLEPRPFYIKELPDGEWRPFLRDVPGIVAGTFVGDRFVAVERDGHPRGRLVSIPVATAADRWTWEELIPESDVVLQYVSRAGDRLLLSELVDASSRLSLAALDGTRLGVIPMPAAGVIALTGAGTIGAWAPMAYSSADHPEVTFVYQSLTVAPAVYQYNVETEDLERLSEPEAERSDLTVRQIWATSADGQQIPFYAVYRDDLDLSEPRPALMHAYAGFNYALMPAYFPHFLEVADAGGVFLLVNARGGSEFGAGWWRGGRKATKQNTFNDVFAAAEKAVGIGLTTHDRLAFEGASNGGMLAGALITQRPEYFAAVVPNVPLLDLLRVDRGTYGGMASAMEYGDPDDPEEAAILFAYSPYHNVTPRNSYPATLIFAGVSDARCPIWHSRKFAARLQAATASDEPVLLRAFEDVGHGTGYSAEALRAATAEWLGFIMNRLGLMPGS
jgi:prolyl oligopeptidase